LLQSVMVAVNPFDNSRHFLVKRQLKQRILIFCWSCILV